MGGATSAPISGATRRDLLGDEDVGRERRVRSVLLGRAGRDEDGVVRLQKGLDLRVRHLAEKHSGRLHKDLVWRPSYRELLARSLQGIGFGGRHSENSACNRLHLA
jgi:hypothetical protein